MTTSSKTTRKSNPAVNVLRNLPIGSWVLEYALASTRQDGLWSRVPIETITRVLQGGGSRYHLTGLRNPSNSPAVVGTSLFAACRLLLDIWHFHLDVDRGSPRMQFRAVEWNTKETIPDWFVTRECMCTRPACCIEREDVDVGSLVAGRGIARGRARKDCAITAQVCA